MIKISERQQDFLEVQASGRLTVNDYRDLFPAIEGMMSSHGKVRLLVVLDEFRGWDPAALIEDLKFDFKHRKDFYRIAVVGDSTVQKMLTQLSRPLFEGEVRYFDRGTPKADIKRWLGVSPPPDRVDRAQAESFPASDAPSFSPR